MGSITNNPWCFWRFSWFFFPEHEGMGDRGCCVTPLVCTLLTQEWLPYHAVSLATDLACRLLPSLQLDLARPPSERPGSGSNMPLSIRVAPLLRNGPSTVSESTASFQGNCGLVGDHASQPLLKNAKPRACELSEILSACYLCAKANSPRFWKNSPSVLSSEALGTVFRPFPSHSLMAQKEEK